MAHWPENKCHRPQVIPRHFLQVPQQHLWLQLKCFVGLQEYLAHRFMSQSLYIRTVHAIFYMFNEMWYLHGGFWFTLNAFLPLVASCIDERSPSVEVFSISQISPRFSVFSRIFQTIWYYFKTATNTTVHYSFAAQILTSMVVGSMSQARYAGVSCGHCREVKGTAHRLAPLTGFCGKVVHNNAQLVI